MKIFKVEETNTTIETYIKMNDIQYIRKKNKFADYIQWYMKYNSADLNDPGSSTYKPLCTYKDGQFFDGQIYKTEDNIDLEQEYKICLREHKLKRILVEYNNHSGGAIGADSYFDEIGREFGVTNHFHYWYKKMNPKSLPEHEITEEEYQEGIEMIKQANKTLKRQNIERYMHLLARNWVQVKNSDTIIAISTIKGKKVSGGTGWAVQMAIDTDKDVYVFDQDKEQWYYWNNKFEVCVTPKLTQNFAGIGTREINEAGIQAIRNVYKKSIN